MSKGKKFTAAEKHFNEKLEKINRETKALKEENRKLRERNEYLEKRNSVLSLSIGNLVEDNKKLMEYSNMTDEDLQNAKERDRTLANVDSISRIMGTSLGALGFGLL